MAVSRIQFQAGLSLPKFIELYGTEENCEAALEQARWPDGFRCPRCEIREWDTLLQDCYKGLRSCKR
ncbi:MULTISPECIES: transposase [unclassified Synechococcus]|uniref:transposase n=1 Tax=unclassified Synechococcus TaxID=2626047 RepID=UPI0020CC8071|nr:MULTISPECIES: transposase [unclassified Synechococcus]